MDNFKAFRIHKEENGRIRAAIETLNLSQLTEGDVVIEVHYSGVNYKDALAATGKGSILKRFPLNGGIDCSGVVAESQSDQFKAGDPVLISGCGLSEVHDGGYAEYVRAPADCVVPLPPGMSLEQAMAIGTPGFTAALALHRMEQNGQRPDKGPIVVTGASGGVGSLAVDLFAGQGYEVVAVSGKAELNDYLTTLGAAKVISRHELDPGSRPLESARWGGAVDTVGGETLAGLTRTVNLWGNIASIGLAGGHELHTTVMPFILRGVSLLGISSTNCPCQLRRDIWQRLGDDLKPRHLEMITDKTITMNELMETFEQMLAGGSRGRTVVSIRT